MGLCSEIVTISLIDLAFREQTAQACVVARLQQRCSTSALVSAEAWIFAEVPRRLAFFYASGGIVAGSSMKTDQHGSKEFVPQSPLG
jgi:hypothetical protein